MWVMEIIVFLWVVILWLIIVCMLLIIWVNIIIGFFLFCGWVVCAFFVWIWILKWFIFVVSVCGFVLSVLIGKVGLLCKLKIVLIFFNVFVFNIFSVFNFVFFVVWKRIWMVFFSLFLCCLSKIVVFNVVERWKLWL